MSGPSSEEAFYGVSTTDCTSMPPSFGPAVLSLPEEDMRLDKTEQARFDTDLWSNSFLFAKVEYRVVNCFAFLRYL